MPSNWLHIDTGFPAFTGEESVSDKVTTIQNYMFMLVEQLRYTLHNLDLSNMNGKAVESFTDYITKPIYGRIENAEGSITSLSLTAEGLSARVSSAEGDITQLGITAQGLGARITGCEGNITSLSLTASGLQTQVANQSGQISSLIQTVGGFALSADNGANYSYLYLSSNGINFGSAYISFTGMVTFTDLSTAGMTTINGANIRTGTISAITLRSVSSSDNGFEVYYGAVSDTLLVGGIRFDANGAGTSDEARYRMFIYTRNGYQAWAMKLVSAGGMSLESGGMLYLRAATTMSLNAPAFTINGQTLKAYIQSIVEEVSA